jgi:hypothetical protein
VLNVLVVRGDAQALPSELNPDAANVITRGEQATT